MYCVMASGAAAEFRRSSRKRNATSAPGASGDDRGMLPYLTPSPCQLKELWNFDNTCAQKYLNVPARRCNAYADEGDHEYISDLDMQQLKSSIELSWKNAVCNFSILGDSEDGRGLSLHVHQFATAPLNYSESSPLMCGWMVVIPNALEPNLSHIYERSTILKTHGGIVYTLYLGGPISYSNWASAETANIHVRTVASERKSFCAKMVVIRGPLTSGTEVLWHYGTSGQWHLPSWYLQGQCCYLDKPKTKKEEEARKKRHELRLAHTLFIWKAKCTLCGFVFSSSNKESRTQPKTHYTRRHPDFLGSDWDGTGQYAGQPIDGNTALQKADLICQGLKFLTEELHARYMPACTVFSHGELAALEHDPLALMEEFRKRELLYIRGGCVIVRGCHRVKDPSCFRRVPLATPFHKIVFAKNGYNRNTRVVPETVDHEERVQALRSELNTSFKVLLQNFYEDDSEDDA